MVNSGKGAQQSVDKQEILEHDQKSVVDEEYMRVLDNFVDQQINGDSYQHKSHLEGLDIHKDSDDLVWNLEEFEKLPVYYTNKNQESGDTIREMADNYFKPILPFSSYLKKQVDEAWFGGIAYPWYPRAQRVRVDAPYVANYYDPYDPYDQAFRPRKPTLRASWRPSLTRNPIGFDYDKPIRSFARTNQYYSRPITSLADQYAYQRIRSRYIEHPMRSRYVSRGFKGILPSYRKEWDY